MIIELRIDKRRGCNLFKDILRQQDNNSHIYIYIYMYIYIVYSIYEWTYMVWVGFWELRHAAHTAYARFVISTPVEAPREAGPGVRTKEINQHLPHGGATFPYVSIFSISVYIQPFSNI